MITSKSSQYYIVALFLLCVFSFSQQKASAAIRMGWNSQVDIAKIAQVNGAYRKDLGETIEWERYNDDSKALKDLDKGKVDIAPIDMIVFTRAVTAGLQVRVIAVASQYGADSGLITRNESQISSPKNLVGKKIAVPFFTSAHYSLLKALEYWKIDASQVTLVNTPEDKIEASWDKGDVDGAYADGITFLHLKNKGREMINSQQLADLGSPTYIFWVVIDNLIPEKPYRLQPFVNAVLKASKVFNQNKDKLTVKSKDIIEVSQLLKITPTDALTLIKEKRYPQKREQEIILSRQLPLYLGQLALFLRSKKMMDNVLPDYLIYLYPSFVNDSVVK